MNKWAASSKYDCNFLCVCVLGDRQAVSLAKNMGSEMKLTHCVNGFIDNEKDLPRYGQLGCQGFIILNSEHRVISTGTSPFMQVRDLAFKHVETLIDAICKRGPLPAICPGEFVEFVNIPEGKADLAGEPGICLRLGEGNQNAVVQVMRGRLRGKAFEVPIMAIRKLQDGDSDDEQGSCAQGGCSTGACKSGTSNGCTTGNCSIGGSTAGGCTTGGCTTGSCATGPCSESNCNSGVALSEGQVDSFLDLVSVKVPSMDAEHEECASALRELVKARTNKALVDVLNHLSEHFAHEESLFDEYGFGVHVNEQFSAKKTHIEDHKRILDKIRQQVSAKVDNVSGTFIQDLLKDFHDHTSRYDTQYSDLLSSKGAK